MDEGAYEHGETGLRLADITARGELDQRSARLTEFSATDGQGGRLTGDGRIDWEEGLDGAVKFVVTGFRALGRDDRNAVVSGEGAVTLDDEAIRVTGDLNVSQARISIEQSASASIPEVARHTAHQLPQPGGRDQQPAQSLPGSAPCSSTSR